MLKRIVLLATLVAPTLAHAIAFTPSVTPTLTETPSPSASPTPTVTQTAVCGSTFGQASFYSGGGVGNDPGNGGQWFEATKYTLSVSGTANSISIYINPVTSNNFRVALYNDNSDYPGTLLVQTGDQSNTLGWNTVAINPTYLVPGNYWIALLMNGAVSTWKDALAGGSNVLIGAAATYGNFPTNLTAPNYGGLITGELRFMYVSYCPGPPIFYTATPSPTASVTPIQYLNSAPVGKAAFGPVPVHKGTPLCLYLPQPALSSSWEVYNLVGQRVASFDADNAAQACWDTTAVAPGFYLVHGSIQYADGSSGSLTQKVVVLP